ncbi:MAG TPA: hypothetical protein PKV73_06195 [Agriterribacter sp.]|nr:hypothetical protein [Agriterribacter sp.]
MKYTDIFVPGGFPLHTYNPRTEKSLEEKINEARENLCKLVTVTGQTKSGKTVITKRLYPKENSIWIDGGSVKSEDDFWNALLDKLEYYQTENITTIEEKSGGSSSEDLVKGELMGIGGSKKYTISENDRTSTTSTKSKSVSTKIRALRALEESKIPLIIDDFHYINRQIQGDLIRALKSPVFEGVPIILIAIPHKRYDAMKVEKEMTGRVSLVSVPSWSKNELLFIPETGFPLLDITFPTNIASELADEAVESPHLMQEFCRRISKQILTETKKIEDIDLKTMYHDVAENIGRPIFEKLMKGPRQRNDRIQRELKSGQSVDIYGLVLSALAYLKPGLISIEYEELRRAIREIISSAPPQMHEVSRVLRHMSTIAATDESSAPVIDFDDKEKKLHITDPFFSFYLKWGTI